MKIRKLKNTEVEKFAKTANNAIRSEIPANYFLDQECWVIQDKNGAFVGGFAIIDTPLPRTLKQTNDIARISLYRCYVAEITAFFIKDKTKSVHFTLMLLLRVLLCRKKLFIYAYDAKETKLKLFYGKGNPKFLCSSIDSNGKHENIEILNKVGVLRIYGHRTLKIVGKLMRVKIERIKNKIRGLP